VMAETNGGEGIDDEYGGGVEVVDEEESFQDKQNQRLEEINKRLHDEAKLRKREWEKEVERMRREFLTLYPENGSVKDRKDEKYVYKRRGSIDILDVRKMRTLFTDTVKGGGCKFKLRFDVKPYRLDSVTVTMESDVVCVSALKEEQTDASGDDDSAGIIEKRYCRKIEKPVEVDMDKIRCSITKDKILIVDAPLPPHTLNIRGGSSSFTGSPSHSFHSHVSSRSRSPSNTRSPAASNTPETPSGFIIAANRPGVAQFGGDPEKRRMNLFVDIGKAYKPKDVTVQCTSNLTILVKAKRGYNTTEFFCKNKFLKEYTLSEEIEPYSIRAGVNEDGKLIIGALGKTHEAVLTGQGGKELWDELSSESSSCNVLDLTSFPIPQPATID